MTLGHRAYRIGIRSYSLGLVGAALALALVWAAPAVAQERRSVLIAFHPGGEGPTVFSRLADRSELALGFLGATQGAYTRRQALLDLGAGARTSASGYDPRKVPRYRLGPGRRVTEWGAVEARARSAPIDVVPGLLAGALPGGAAFVAGELPSRLEGVVAADRSGALARVSLGSDTRVVERARAALARHRLVVTTLPLGVAGDAALDELLARRTAGELLIVVRRPPRSRATQMLPLGIAGLGKGGRLTSRTTRRVGLVAGIDLAPTVLSWLGLPLPDAVRGRPIVATGTHDVSALRALERRLRVVYPRRLPVLTAVVLAVALLGLGLAVLGARRRALRVVALAIMWVPAMTLVTAALAPQRPVELALMAGGVCALALTTDLALGWPRGPALPALVGVGMFMGDLLAGSPLIVRSLLGPNPRFGARFYGIGNELEAALPVLALLGLAGALATWPRSRRLAAAFAGALLALGAFVGAGRLGADVGGVITIGAGGAVAALSCLPGGLTRARILWACAAPAAALVLLAAVDLVSGGDSHFTSTVLRADGGGDLWSVADRRLSLAWASFESGATPLLTLVIVCLIVVAWLRRERWYAPVAASPAWLAALLGGLVAAISGTLANDSGPVLLIVGGTLLGCGTLYVRGRPAPPVDDRQGSDVRTGAMAPVP